MNDGDLHDQIRTRITEGDTDNGIDTHLNACIDCRHWADKYATVARLLDAEAVRVGSAGPDDLIVARIASAVRSDQRTRTIRRYTQITTGAAAAVLVGVIGLNITKQGDDASRISAALDAWDSGTRFVYEARINVDIEPSPSDVVAMSLRALPTCNTTPPPDEPSPAEIDVTRMLDQLLTGDSCTALRTISDRLSPQTEQAATDAATAQRFWATQLDALNTRTPTGRPLTEATLQAATQLAEQNADLAHQHLDRILTAHQQAVTALADAASRASTDDSFDTIAPAVRGELDALAATLDNNPTQPPDTLSIGWDSLATGTWTADTITIAGTSTNEATGALGFDTADNDPLGIASILLDNPDTLRQILRTAPDTAQQETTWNVPPDASPTLFGTTTATVTLNGDRIDTIVLATSLNNDSLTITITAGR